MRNTVKNFELNNFELKKLNFEVWVKDLEVFDCRFGFSMATLYIDSRGALRNRKGTVKTYDKKSYDKKSRLSISFFLIFPSWL